MPGPPITDTFGALLIGLLLSSMLLGLTVVQTWIYFWNYRNKDPKALMFFIAFVSAMDVLHTIICAYAVYWYLVLNFGNFENLDNSMWAMSSQVSISTFVSAPVQFYYARRIYILSKDIICPIVIVVLAIFSTCMQYLFTAKVIALKKYSRLASVLWLPIAGPSADALANSLIAAAMCWSLYRRRTGFARTDSVIMSLMAYSINSGLLVCLLAVAQVITFVASPPSLITGAIFWAMSKCYVNSFLAVLNSRDYIRDRSTATAENAIHLSSIRIQPSSNGHGPKCEPPGVSVTVHRSPRLNLGRAKSDHDVEPTFDVPKPANITGFQSQDRT